MPQTENETQYFVFGPFLYDIDKALKIIASTPGRATHPITVSEFARTLGLEKTLDEYRAQGQIPMLRGDVDEEYARTQADLTIPVIIGDLRQRDEGTPAYMLIDGTHRLRRAFLEGREHLDAYVLTLAETKKIRRSSTYGAGRTRRNR